MRGSNVIQLIVPARTYDEQQLTNDLNLIVEVFGKREQCGFYTVGKYADSHMSINQQAIGGNPELFAIGTGAVDQSSVNMRSELAEHIMLKAMYAMELQSWRQPIKF